MQFDTLKSAVHDVRVVLVDKYLKFEANIPNIQVQFFDGAHSLLCDMFRRCRDCTRKGERNTHRNSDLDCWPMNPEGAKSTSSTFQDAECTFCCPKVKRKRNGIDDGSHMKPTRKTRSWLIQDLESPKDER